MGNNSAMVDIISGGISFCMLFIINYMPIVVSSIFIDLKKGQLNEVIFFIGEIISTAGMPSLSLV